MKLLDEREAIMEAGFKVLNGVLRPVKRPGYCLAFVRQIVEHALDMEPGEFYKEFVDPYFKLRPGERLGVDIHPRWARGAERALRVAGLAVPLLAMRPGDLLFSYRVSRPYGHVGILMPGNLVLENTTADRGWKKEGRGAIRLTPLSEWDPITTAVKLEV